jgi:hypothetical protein
MASDPVPQRFTQLVTGTVSLVEFLGVAANESVIGFPSSSRSRCLKIAVGVAHRCTTPFSTAFGDSLASQSTSALADA